MKQPIKFIIESLLFVTEDPLSVQHIKQYLEIEETDTIRTALNELVEEYAQRRGGFELRQVAGGFQFRTRSEYSEWVKKLLKPSPSRLSRASLETLAIIAYKQPIIRADVEHIRGVDCGGVLRMLLEKKLIRVLGRKDIPGRPMIYGTTRQFLEVFNLKDLRDLPSPKEIESLGAEAEEDLSLSQGQPVDQLPPLKDSTPSAQDTLPGSHDPDADPAPVDGDHGDGATQEAASDSVGGHEELRKSGELEGSASEISPQGRPRRDVPADRNHSRPEGTEAPPDRLESIEISNESDLDRKKS